jgi:hypothetical protein
MKQYASNIEEKIEYIEFNDYIKKYIYKNAAIL